MQLLIMRNCLAIILTLSVSLLKAENGYDLWLRYTKISNPALLAEYKKQINSPAVLGSSQTISIIKAELSKAFHGFTGTSYTISSSSNNSATFIAGVASSSSIISSIITKDELSRVGNEGFIIKAKPGKTIITANTDIGLLYGVFHFLRPMQMQQPVTTLTVISSPKINLRLLNH